LDTLLLARKGSLEQNQPEWVRFSLVPTATPIGEIVPVSWPSYHLDRPSNGASSFLQEIITKIITFPELGTVLLTSLTKLYLCNS